MEEYIEKYINTPVYLRMCRVWEEDTKSMVYMPIGTVNHEDEDKIMMYPIGLEDDSRNPIYVGDLLKVIIETKYGEIERIGVVRREGMYACGIDYLDKDGNVTEDGDFIDEFYIKEKHIIGNIKEGVFKNEAVGNSSSSR
jgi:hypothetical protein